MTRPRACPAHKSGVPAEKGRKAARFTKCPSASRKWPGLNWRGVSHCVLSRSTELSRGITGVPCGWDTEALPAGPTLTDSREEGALPTLPGTRRGAHLGKQVAAQLGVSRQAPRHVGQEGNGALDLVQHCIGVGQ